MSNSSEAVVGFEDFAGICWGQGIGPAWMSTFVSYYGESWAFRIYEHAVEMVDGCKSGERDMPWHRLEQENPPLADLARNSLRRHLATLPPKHLFVSDEAKASATVETPMVTEMLCEKCGFKCDSRGASHATGWKLWCDACKRDAQPVTGSGTNWAMTKEEAEKGKIVFKPTAYSAWMAVNRGGKTYVCLEAMRAMYEKCQNPEEGDKEFDASLERIFDPTRAAVELEMSEVTIRKYRELKQLVWKNAKGAMQRQYSSWPWCSSCSQPKKLQAELFGGNIIPAFGCPCGVVFVKPYGAPVDLVRRAAALGNPQVVCGEQDGAK